MRNSSRRLSLTGGVAGRFGLDPGSIVKIAVYSFLLLAIYYSALAWLVTTDWVRSDYSYGYILPFLIVYLIWERRNVFAGIPARLSWAAFVPLCLGLALFWLGELAGEFFTLYASIWMTVVSLVWLHLGWGGLKQLAFPVVMILAMFPFPNFLNLRILNTLKIVSSKLGVTLLQMYGMSVFREGNVIDLGFTQLQVVDACSGLRYVMPLLVLSLVLAYWLRDAWWKRVVVVLSSIPLAITVNSLRIAITGILYSIWGAAVAEQFFHGFSSWLIFIGMIPFLLLEIWLLHKLPNGFEPAQPTYLTQPTQPTQRFFSPHFVVAVVLLGSTLGLSHAIDFREKVPVRQPLSQFPKQLSLWSGVPEALEQTIIRELDLSDYAVINYRDTANKEVNFYVAYYQSQRKGESIHSPETCLPASGWEFQEAGSVTVPMKRGNPGALKVNRAFMTKPGVSRLVYFWFPQRGRVLTNAYQLKFYTFWDALTRRRTDGALVRVITPVYPGEKILDAESRLQSFTRSVVPILSEYIPN